MSTIVDVPRLQSTLGAPELSRVLDALQRRIELGRPIGGELTLASVSPAERSAIDAIFGRNSSRGSSLRIDLDFLAATLREAGICDDLGAAVRALRGTIVDRRAMAAQRDRAWAEVWRTALAGFAARPVLSPWLTKLDRLGIMRRLCDHDPNTGSFLLRDLALVANALPAGAEPLASFAARLFGNAHALDPGTPRGSLAVRAAARIGGVAFDDNAEGRRAAWAAAGILCDELSTPVLVYNLAPSDDSPVGRWLRSAKDAAEPVHLSLRLLLRWPLGSHSGLAGEHIYVCENPTIVALAAERLGRGCAPMLCVNGQFATPVLVLLRQLRAAGARLHYHGDFDPAGVNIAHRVMKETDAMAWRFGAADYAAAPKSVAFAAAVGPTPWDPALRDAMQAAGQAVHEEALFDSLAADLARPDQG